MPTIPVKLHKDAIAEARSAREWYEAQSPAAAEGFLSELDHAIEQIAALPEAWPPHSAGTRHYPLRRFPFSIIYRKRRKSIQVIAVAHNHRKPGYWKARKKD